MKTLFTLNYSSPEATLYAQKQGFFAYGKRNGSRSRKRGGTFI